MAMDNSRHKANKALKDLGNIFDLKKYSLLGTIRSELGDYSLLPGSNVTFGSGQVYLVALAKGLNSIAAGEATSLPPEAVGWLGGIYEGLQRRLLGYESSQNSYFSSALEILNNAGTSLIQEGLIQVSKPSARGRGSRS